MTTIRGVTDASWRDFARVSADIQDHFAAMREVNWTFVDSIRSLERTPLLQLAESQRLFLQSQSAISSSLRTTASQLNIISETLAAARIPPNFGTHLALLEKQTAWVSDLARTLNDVNLAPIFRQIGSAGGEIAGLFDQFRSVLQETGSGVDGTSEHAPDDLVNDLTEALETAAQGDSVNLRVRLQSVLSRLTHTDGSVPFLLVVVVINCLIAIASQVLTVEYGRLRNSVADAARDRRESQQTLALEEANRQLARIYDRATHPPLIATTTRIAHLRSGPDSTSNSVRRLTLGTPLIVYERRSGWVRVEAEPTPGDVYEGWVYGKLVRYR